MSQTAAGLQTFFADRPVFKGCFCGVRGQAPRELIVRLAFLSGNRAVSRPQTRALGRHWLLKRLPPNLITCCPTGNSLEFQGHANSSIPEAFYKKKTNKKTNTLQERQILYPERTSLSPSPVQSKLTPPILPITPTRCHSNPESRCRASLLRAWS